MVCKHNRPGNPGFAVLQLHCLIQFSQNKKCICWATHRPQPAYFVAPPPSHVSFPGNSVMQLQKTACAGHIRPQRPCARLHVRAGQRNVRAGTSALRVVGPCRWLSVLHARDGWTGSFGSGTDCLLCCFSHPPGYRSEGDGQTVTAPSTQQANKADAAAASIVAVPRSIHDVDNGKILGFGADLAEDHPVGAEGVERGRCWHRDNHVGGWQQLQLVDGVVHVGRQTTAAVRSPARLSSRRQKTAHSQRGALTYSCFWVLLLCRASWMSPTSSAV